MTHRIARKLHRGRWFSRHARELLEGQFGGEAGVVAVAATNCIEARELLAKGVIEDALGLSFENRKDFLDERGQREDVFAEKIHGGDYEGRSMNYEG